MYLVSYSDFRPAKSFTFLLAIGKVISCLSISFQDQASQNVQGIPQLVNDKVGPIKIQNPHRTSEYDRICLQEFAHRLEEKLRRMTGEGHVSVKFYIKAKDTTINKKCLVPITFTVDMVSRTIKTALDETRL